ncbi:MAG: hypothetical protein FJX46_08525 [Alphaproteobacteria bacterium]|nr:hypothetical protein [Alphaproteobacteria bacterium]
MRLVTALLAALLVLVPLCGAEAQAPPPPPLIEIPTFNVPIIAGGKPTGTAQIRLRIRVNEQPAVAKVNKDLAKLQSAFNKFLYDYLGKRKPDEAVLNLEEIKAGLEKEARQVFGDKTIVAVLFRQAQLIRR